MASPVWLCWKKMLELQNLFSYLCNDNLVYWTRSTEAALLYLLFLFAQLSTCRSWNNLRCSAGQDAVIVFRFEASIKEQRHAITQNVQFAVAVDFQIVREDECIAVAINQSLILWCVRFFDVPATDGIAINLRIENDVGFVVIELSSCLRFGSSITQQCVGVVSVVWCCQSFIFQNCVGNWEFFCWR